MTKDEIQHGITTQQFVLGLERDAQGGWNWNVDRATGLLASQASTIESTSSTVPHVRESTSSAEMTISKLDELFGVRKISVTPSHNTLEVKKEHLELRERMSAERIANDSPSPSPGDISNTPKEVAQHSTTQATPDLAAPISVFDQPVVLVPPSDLPPQKNYMFLTHIEKPSDTTQPPSSKVVTHRTIRTVRLLP